MSCPTSARPVLRRPDGGGDLGAGHAHETWSASAQPRAGATPGAALGPTATSTVIEAMRPGQQWPLIAVHVGLSSTSRRLRYSAPTPQLSPKMVRALTDLRPGQHEAYAAWREGQPIGIVRWIRIPDEPDMAELALEVVDAQQSRGVGRTLAAFAAVQAWRAGVRTLVMSVDPHNGRVRGWLATRHARALLDDADRFALPTTALLAG